MIFRIIPVTILALSFFTGTLLTVAKPPDIKQPLLSLTPSPASMWPLYISIPGLHTTDAAADVKKIIVGPRGNIYLAGQANKEKEGTHDIFVIKLDPTGKRLWSQFFSTSFSDLFYDLAVDKGQNVFLAGYAGTGIKSAKSATPFLAMMNAKGETQWLRELQLGVSSRHEHIAVDDSGSVYVVGSVIYRDDKRAIYVAKYQPDGKEGWIQTLHPNQPNPDVHSLQIAFDAPNQLRIASVVPSKNVSDNKHKIWMAQLSRSSGDILNSISIDVPFKDYQSIHVRFAPLMIPFIGDGFLLGNIPWGPLKPFKSSMSPTKAKTYTFNLSPKTKNVAVILLIRHKTRAVTCMS